MPHVSEEIYEAVLPEEYKKRWRILQDKVAKNTETRQRGVLISHPHEDYELLEERLLETLELERPRIRQHHFLGTKSTDGIDSGFESSSQAEESSDSELEPKEKCPDCGKVMSCNIEQERKWMVKVYAANGLMKEGAWAAAWQEMEKVDVEVGIWMPEEVRMEVEERLTALQAQHEAEKSVDEGPPSFNRRLRSKSGRTKLRQEERMKEIYGEAGRAKTQDEIDGLTEEPKSAQHKDSEAKVTLPKDEPRVSSESSATPDRRPHVTFAPEPVSRSSCNQPDISSLIQHRHKKYHARSEESNHHSPEHDNSLLHNPKHDYTNQIASRSRSSSLLSNNINQSRISYSPHNQGIRNIKRDNHGLRNTLHNARRRH